MATKTHGKTASRQLKKALETIAAGRSITLPLEVTLSPYQWFVMQSIATGKRQTISQVFKDYFVLNDTRLLEESNRYVEP